VANLLYAATYKSSYKYECMLMPRFHNISSSPNKFSNMAGKKVVLAFAVLLSIGLCSAARVAMYSAKGGVL
jgi:hypothetical protein